MKQVCEKPIEREERWDFYKGLLMFSVILGHSITALKAGADVRVWLTLFIRTFDMPMFAFISGYFLRKSCNRHDVHINILNKIGSILFPVILWNWIFNFASGSIRFGIGRFWFLWSIFFISCIVICIDFVGKKLEILKLPLFAAAILIFHTMIIDPWNIGFLLFPCVVGYYYDSIIAFFGKVGGEKKWKAGMAIVFIIGLLFWKVDYNVWHIGCSILKAGALRKIVFRGVIGITGCFTAKWVYDIVYDAIKVKKYPIIARILTGGVENGKITMEIYILQSYFVEFCGAWVIRKTVDYIGFNLFAMNAVMLSMIYGPIVALISIIVIGVLARRIKAIPYIGSYIFGLSTKVKYRKNDEGKYYNEEV